MTLTLVGSVDVVDTSSVFPEHSSCVIGELAVQTAVSLLCPCLLAQAVTNSGCGHRVTGAPNE